MPENTVEDVLEAPSNTDTPSLTKWVNEPTIMDLKRDFEAANTGHQQHIIDVERWMDNLNVTGQAKPKKRKGKSAIQPKLIRRQAEWRYAALSEPFLSTDDIFNTAPSTAEDKTAAVQNGLVLNHQFNNQLEKEDLIDEYIRTLVDEGTAFFRVGWEFKEQKVKEMVTQYEYQLSNSPEVLALHKDLHRMMQEEPYLYEDQPDELKEAHRLTMQFGKPYQPIAVGQEEEEFTKVVLNRPSVEICDYRNLRIDPSCKGVLDKANFVIYSFETSLAELEMDGKYKNLDKINISKASILGDPDHSPKDDTNFNFDDKPRKKFVAYEYWGNWDIHGDGTLHAFVATWVNDVFIRMDLNPFPDQEHPFVGVQYLPVRKSLYGEPDGELIEDNQQVIGAVTRGMIDILGRSANGQIGSAKDALDVTNRRKFVNGEDYEYNPGSNPAEAFYMHTFPEIPQSASFMLGTQQADAESLSGVKAYSNGITGRDLGDSTGLGMSALDAAAKREFGILRRVARGIKRVGLKIVSMNGEFLQEKEVVRITNEDFVTVRRSDLKGNYDLKLSISTPEADEAKAKELAFMLQTMDSSTDPSIRNLLLAEIATLRKMPDLAKKLRDYQPQPDPLAVKKQELEIAKLEAEIAEVYSKAQLNQSKASTEGSKAENLSADTDNKSLDFVERESGVTQARDLEKAGEQAKGNIDLKLTEAAINDRQTETKDTE